MHHSVLWFNEHHIPALLSTKLPQLAFKASHYHLTKIPRIKSYSTSEDLWNVLLHPDCLLHLDWLTVILCLQEDPKYQQDGTNICTWLLRAYSPHWKMSLLGLVSNWAKVTGLEHTHASLSDAACVPLTSFIPLLLPILFILSFFESQIIRSGMMSWPTLLK